MTRRSRVQDGAVSVDSLPLFAGSARWCDSCEGGPGDHEPNCPDTFERQAERAREKITPDIRTPLASQAGSETSEAAADFASGPFRRASYRKIVLALYQQHPKPMSAPEIAAATNLPLNVVWLRIRVGELRPLWIQTHKGACESAQKPGLRVDGFTLTDATIVRLKASHGATR